MPSDAGTRLLATGCCGFIGSNFLQRVLGQNSLGDDVRVVNVDKLSYAADPANLDPVSDDPRYAFVEADIADRAAIEPVVRDLSPTHVVNFAAESHVDRSIADASPFVRSNVMGTQVLLDLVRTHADDLSLFLQVSTDEVYGSIELGAFSEEDPLEPSSPYSASKAAADHFVQAAHVTHGLPVAITRCTNNYGPRQHAEKLIPKTITNALNDRPIPVYGDGLNERDWIHVDDHNRAVESVLTQPGKAVGEVFNIGAGNQWPNIELVETILDLLDKPADLIEFVEDRPGHDFRYAVDTSKIERVLGWTPKFTEFRDGLAHTIEWYRGRVADRPQG